MLLCRRGARAPKFSMRRMGLGSVREDSYPCSSKVPVWSPREASGVGVFVGQSEGRYTFHRSGAPVTGGLT